MFNGHVLIYKEGEVVFNNSYGQLSPGSTKSINANTPFRLASLSKQFTAMAILHLQSKGKLKLGDEVKQYIADFPYEGVIIRNLLNQTSGIPEYQDFLNENYDKLKDDYIEDNKVVSNETINNIFLARRPALEFAPGASFNYSNSNYIFLAQIIENVSGLSFGDYLNEFFFTPLNMNNSWVSNSDNYKEEKAIGYRKNLITDTFSENETPEFLKAYGDGGIYSSANDLLKWFEALDSGEVMDKEVLHQAYVKPTIGEEEGPYGFGWFVRTLPFNGNKALTHSGEFAGFSNALFRDLDANTTVIILSNNSHKVRSEINSAVIRILYGVPFELPMINAEAILSDMVLSGEIGKAKEFYSLNKDNEQYDFSEEAFNKFGYECLYAKKYDAAIEIFKWNIQMHPNSSNSNDSLGEAYLESGNEDMALKYYSVAYKLNPKNANAKSIIDRLSNK